MFLVLSLILAFVIYLNLNSIKEVTTYKLPQKFEFIRQELAGETAVLLAGDVMLGREVMIRALDKKDASYPFRKVGSVLQSADVVFVNLEVPIVTGCPRTSTGLVFCTDPALVEGLKYAGVDVVTLANNHTGNYGVKGIEETKDYLKKAGIAATGVGELVIKKVNGVTYGFLGFDWVVRDPTTSELQLISDSDPKVDILIVGIHWGVEYRDKANAFQRKWAREVVNRGADVVTGHHPHWVQDTEYINGKPVYYSLGNFVFDQMWSEETKKGLVAKLTFDRYGKIIKEEQLHTYMADWGQPEFR